MSKVNVGDVFYKAVIGKSYVSLYLEDDIVELRKEVTPAIVLKVYVNAIHRLEVNEESKKYFFTVKEKYYYSTQDGGVTEEYAYFIPNDSGKPDGGSFFNPSGGSFFNTRDEALEVAHKWDASQAKSLEARCNLIRSNLMDVLEQL